MNFSDVMSRTYCESAIAGAFGFALGYAYNNVDRLKYLVEIPPKTNSYQCGLAVAVTLVSLVILKNAIQYYCRQDIDNIRAGLLYTNTFSIIGLSSAIAFYDLGLITMTGYTIQYLAAVVLFGAGNFIALYDLVAWMDQAQVNQIRNQFMRMNNRNNQLNQRLNQLQQVNPVVNQQQNVQPAQQGQP